MYGLNRLLAFQPFKRTLCIKDITSASHIPDPRSIMMHKRSTQRYCSSINSIALKNLQSGQHYKNSEL